MNNCILLNLVRIQLFNWFSVREDVLPPRSTLPKDIAFPLKRSSRFLWRNFSSCFHLFRCLSIDGRRKVHLVGEVEELGCRPDLVMQACLLPSILCLCLAGLALSCWLHNTVAKFHSRKHRKPWFYAIWNNSSTLIPSKSHVYLSAGTTSWGDRTVISN